MTVRRGRLVVAGLAVAGLLAGGGACAQPSPSSDSEAFAAANAAAMAVMMRDMHVAPSGHVDRDFAAMMIPHHQGAVDMALAELRFGRDARLRRLAQEIIVTQLSEIAVMRLTLDDLPEGAAPGGHPHSPEPER